MWLQSVSISHQINSPHTALHEHINTESFLAVPLFASAFTSTLKSSSTLMNHCCTTLDFIWKCKNVSLRSRRF